MPILWWLLQPKSPTVKLSLKEWHYLPHTPLNRGFVEIWKTKLFCFVFTNLHRVLSRLGWIRAICNLLNGTFVCDLFPAKPHRNCSVYYPSSFQREQKKSQTPSWIKCRQLEGSMAHSFPFYTLCLLTTLLFFSLLSLGWALLTDCVHLPTHFFELILPQHEP